MMSRFITAPLPKLRLGPLNMVCNAATPAAAATGADFVFCCVGDDPDVLAVALGDEGAIPAMKSGAVFIDNSTVSADVARQLYAAGKSMV